MSDDREEKDDLVAHEKTDANYDARLDTIRQQDNTDAKFGFRKVDDSKVRTAWLVNFQSSEAVDNMSKKIVSAVDFYFLEPDGRKFKITYPFRPYLYLIIVPEYEFIVAAYLEKKYDFVQCEHVEKEDLGLKNHLSGLKSKFLKVYFPSTVEMLQFKKDVLKFVKRNKDTQKNTSDYTKLLAKNMGVQDKMSEVEPQDQIMDIREYDLPYHMRVCIDERIFAGLWYDTQGLDPDTRRPMIRRNTEIVEPMDPGVCAYDIETTKLPLKFPDSDFDQIMMISYMIDGRGFLLINREIVSADVEDFEYTPKPEFKGEFKVFNEASEKEVILRFFEHLLRYKPSIMVTYNGDFFDWPFVEARAKFHGLDMSVMVGFSKDSQDEYKSACCAHMDAFRWVKRDSYLPMGSQNLKATTKAKLRYDPVELDPELMCEMARADPQTLASYSVSDAVATYYLYMKYVHPFIFALCTIIPLGPDDVLRKGSGTLCEALLMVEAFHKNIIFPNKQIQKDHDFTNDGHLIDTETYVGARVEALESGVFRADIPVKFRLDVERLAMLKQEVPEAMRHTLSAEMGVDLEEITDFDEVCETVRSELDGLIEHPNRFENPNIYHLDVGAMYPNIILTNRLQPPAMVTDEECLACVYNTPTAKCKRELEWRWRAEVIPASKGEYERIRHRLEEESFGKPPKPFYQLQKEEQLRLEKKRVSEYCRRAYGKQHLTREEKRRTRICQRENPFYVNTVRAFRDRRYEYKAMLKKAKATQSALEAGDLAGHKTAAARVVLYESLQLAHKCILNSFYGYVMRRGSRWFSMEMAGIVCNTGSDIISEACELVEKIGRPLELDTDGIWCLLPGTFPENFSFTLRNGKKATVAYPGAVLNALVKDRFTNDQYHHTNEDGTVEIRQENSIFFEVDGPYLSMILPAAKEAGKKLKKRYAVFNFDGSLAELKGFEVKRRGELGIIKQFQTEVFKDFLKGTTLAEVYANVAKEADYWLDILETKGRSIPDEELFELIAENRSMSRKLEDYGAQKSTSITTARRLAEFLGEGMVKNAGLACRFVVSREPVDTPVTERTIPIAIFQTDQNMMVKYLKKWTKNSSMDGEVDVRDIIDWNYYTERLNSTIQKIITIPAALQGLENPVPRVKHPDWLEKEKRNRLERHLQPRIDEIFKKKEPPKAEDGTPLTPSRKRPLSAVGNTQANELTSFLVPTTPKRSRVIARQTPTSQNTLVKKTFAKDGFHQWLKYLTEKWRRQRASRRRDAVQKKSVESRGLTTIQQMVAANHQRIVSRPWSIIQIVPLPTPGSFRLFAIVDGQMQRIELLIPRIFYVDDEYERGGNARPVDKILPRSRPHRHLYEYTIMERNFQSNQITLAEQRCQHRINGIYETQIPLEFRALLTMGAVSRVKATMGMQRLSVEQMERVSRAEHPYAKFADTHLLYFYEFVHQQRIVCGLFIPSESRAHVYIVNKSKLDIPNLKTLYATENEKFLSRLIADGIDTQPPPETQSLNFEVHQTVNLRDVGRQIAATIKQLKWADVQPAIVCVQSNRDPEEFRKQYTSLNNFPQIRLPFKDSQQLMNDLSWVKRLSTRMMHNFLNSFILLSDLWDIAEYSGVPVGNLPEDLNPFAWDIFYARALTAQNHILWATAAGRPDFGGKEYCDWRLGNDWESVAFRTPLSHVFDCETFEARSICVEFEMGVLAVSALLQSVAIAEAEGTTEQISFASDRPHMTIEGTTRLNSARQAAMQLNEAAAVAPALRILKSVCSAMIPDIRPGRPSFADQLITNIYPWIRSHSALLYEPAIEQAVFTLMRKLCLLLVTELNRLGATVLHCSFTRVVISTNRHDLASARSFVDTLRSSLRQKNLFRHLNLVPIVYSRLMVWINASNNASIKCYDPMADAETNEELEANNKIKVAMSLTAVLPETGDCRHAFVNNIVAYYLVLLAKKARENPSDEEFAAYAGDIFRDTIASKLFEMVLKLRDAAPHLRSLIESERLLLHAAYEHHGKPDMALELVKCAFKIFGLSPYSQDVIDEIRGQALVLLKRDEISADTFWTPPAVSVVLEQVLCPHCSINVEIDVGTQPQPRDGANPNETFNCPFCRRFLPTSLIEELLINRMTRIQISYYLQDYKCSRCKMVSTRALSPACGHCCAPFEPTVTPLSFELHLRMITELADIYKLRNLAAVVGSMSAEFGIHSAD